MARQLHPPRAGDEFATLVDLNWWAFYTVANDARGELVISALRFQHTRFATRSDPPPAGGLTRDVLKRFRWGTLLRRAKRAIAAESWARPVPEAKRDGPGRPPSISAPEYRRLERRLVQLEDSGHPTPLKQLWLENPGVSRTAMAQRMSRWRNSNAPVSQPLAESGAETKMPRKKRGL